MKNSSRLAWALCSVITLIILANLVITFRTHPMQSDIFAFTSSLADFLIPIAFAFQGALILSRQPGNAIGWLLMVPALNGALQFGGYFLGFEGPPAQPSLLLYIALWYAGWSWVPFIFSILFLPMLFPTGKPLSPRWRWPVILGLGMIGFFILFGTFSSTFDLTNLGRSIPNPIGFIPADAWDRYIAVPWFIGLISLTISSVLSLIFRYRHAAAVEREQIKWLLYACAMFAVVYIPGIWLSDTTASDAWYTVLTITILAIPAAITTAILRYRLWDIDLIIRRTLLYGVLSGLLGLVYFGSVVLLRQLMGGFTGNSSAALVISTLLVAALFNPLRGRLQNLIDRRFYRPRYNAALTLDEFAAVARSEVGLPALSDQLSNAVISSLQPEVLGLWLRKPLSDRGKTNFTENPTLNAGSGKESRSS